MRGGDTRGDEILGDADREDATAGKPRSGLDAETIISWLSLVLGVLTSILPGVFVPERGRFPAQLAGALTPNLTPAVCRLALARQVALRGIETRPGNASPREGPALLGLERIDTAG